MNRDQALAKIKKCLALGKSANEHEAAAAMRQAQALMAAHGVSNDDVQLSDVAEARTRSKCTAFNRWESELSHCIADAFGCSVFSVRRSRLLPGLTVRYQRDLVFVGVGPAAEVATYAYDALSRQCVAARLAHIRQQPASCKPITKTARGDRFALGWVFAVRQLVERFAGAPGDMALIEQYIAKHHPSLTTVRTKDKSVGRNCRDDDLHAGFKAGQSATLNRGLGGAAAAPRLGAR